MMAESVDFKVPLKVETVGQITSLVVRWSDGDQRALDRLVPLVYRELRRLAAYQLRHERRDHTLSATALVHEAYLRLVDQEGKNVKTRAHFLRVAAHVMRQVLVDYARGRAAAKRGGVKPTLSLDEELVSEKSADSDLIALDDALTSLARFDFEKSQIVEMRFFAGLSVDEVAEILGSSPRTVARHWALAKAWLYGEMARGQS